MRFSLGKDKTGQPIGERFISDGFQGGFGKMAAASGKMLCLIILSLFSWLFPVFEQVPAYSCIFPVPL